jgi:hypothetical protein
MAVAAHANPRTPRRPRWLASLRFALRGAGALGCAAAMVATPQLISEMFRGGAPLTALATESLLAYRSLALAAGVALIALAEFLPRLVLHPELLLAPFTALPALLVLAACVALKAAFGPVHAAYTSLVREDSLVEYATCLAYLGAGGFAASVALGLRRHGEIVLAVLWAGFTAALALSGFEEISWGQRLFGVQTPELLASNVQHEMNLHNLPWLQRCLHGAYILVGLFGGLAWALLPRLRSAGLRELARWIVPPPALLAYFLPVAVFYAVFDFTPARWITPDHLRFGFISDYDQEPVELLLSVGFLLFAVYGWIKLNGAVSISALPDRAAHQGRERGAQDAPNRRPLVGR